MSELNHQVLEKKKIIKAIIISLVIGTIILIGAVLPAEYGIDPTGAGKLFGFSRLYIPDDTETLSTTFEGTVSNTDFPIIKLEKAGSNSNIERPVEANNPPPAEQFEHKEDSVQVIVPAGKGVEFKINMLKYGQMKYEWATANREVLYFDFHGEVKQETEIRDVYFESYTMANSNNMVGTFLAPYEGKHGWFFRNSSNTDVVINLRLKGSYIL